MNAIRKVLSKVNINALLKENITKTQRIILKETHEESIVLFHWKKNQRLPYHSHCGDCHYQLVHGSILEKRRCSNNVLFPGNKGFIGKNQWHSMLPLTNSISIHCYRPPPKCMCPTMEHIKRIL